MDWEAMCKMTLSREFEVATQSGNNRKVAQSGLCTAAPRRQNEFLEVPIISGEPPVSLGIDIAEMKIFLQAFFDPGSCIGHFPGDKFNAAQRRFMVEEDTAAAENMKTFPVVDRGPVREEFGDAVRAAGMKRSCLRLDRIFFQAAEHLGSRCLIKFCFRMHLPDRFQQIDGPEADDLGCQKRFILQTSLDIFFAGTYII